MLRHVLPVVDIKRRETGSYLLATAGNKGVTQWSLEPLSGSLAPTRVRARLRLFISQILLRLNMCIMFRAGYDSSWFQSRLVVLGVLGGSRMAVCWFKQWRLHLRQRASWFRCSCSLVELMNVVISLTLSQVKTGIMQGSVYTCSGGVTSIVDVTGGSTTGLIVGGGDGSVTVFHGTGKVCLT